MNVNENLWHMNIHFGSAFLLSLFAVTAQANTPDAIPPANESICDELKAEYVF